MDKLSIIVNPASVIGEAHIAGLCVTTEEIAKYVWDGLSIDDICLLYPGLSALAIYNACWFEAKYGSGKWKSRWRSWMRIAEKKLSEEDLDNLPLPPQDLEYIRDIGSTITEYGSVAIEKILDRKDNKDSKE